MKKVIIIIGIIIVIGLLHNYESIYNREVTVINNKGNTVVCVDKSGHIWEYQGNATIGEKVILIMHDNHTDTITDDIIKGVKR